MRGHGGAHGRPRGVHLCTALHLSRRGKPRKIQNLRLLSKLPQRLLKLRGEDTSSRRKRRCLRDCPSPTTEKALCAGNVPGPGYGCERRRHSILLLLSERPSQTRHTECATQLAAGRKESPTSRCAREEIQGPSNNHHRDGVLLRVDARGSSLRASPRLQRRHSGVTQRACEGHSRESIHMRRAQSQVELGQPRGAAGGEKALQEDEHIRPKRWHPCVRAPTWVSQVVRTGRRLRALASGHSPTQSETHTMSRSKTAQASKFTPIHQVQLLNSSDFDPVKQQET